MTFFSWLYGYIWGLPDPIHPVLEAWKANDAWLKRLKEDYNFHDYDLNTKSMSRDSHFWIEYDAQEETSILILAPTSTLT